ncbi:MAG TPA: hypothetical protein PLU22_20705 [Polyangiaceae bacterium]|nr:hypothetical protein [Polyangiaceae bacterium]
MANAERADRVANRDGDGAADNAPSLGTGAWPAALRARAAPGEGL